MKSIHSLAWLFAVGTMVMTTDPLRASEADHNPIMRGGAGLLHFNFSTALTGAGAAVATFGEPDARGRIEGSQTRFGNANNQSLIISVANLKSNTTYWLTAFVGDDTNSTSIAPFMTDKKGGFRIVYAKNAQNRPTEGRERLPDALDPLCNVRELNVVNGRLETVLRADLSNPETGRYLVRRSMSNPGFTPAATGDFRIISTPSSTRFRLQASGLPSGTDFRLMINGIYVQTYRSDSRGKLILTGLPDRSPNVLDIQTLSFTDNSGANVVLISGGLGIPCTTATQSTINLRTAANFAVLAGSTVANTGLTSVKGNLGVYPGSAVTGFPPGKINGIQHAADPTAAMAQINLTTAYDAAAGRSHAPVTVSGNLGGLTLVPGLYKSTSSLEISSGNLTLDARGDANGVFIFQIASTLTTTPGRQVILSGGARAANVFWQVGTSATLGTTTVFKGTIMADQAITLQTGATLEGRALARIAAVTMDANAVTVPAP